MKSKKMLKKTFTWAVTLFVLTACMLSACDDSKTDEIPVVPSVTLTAGKPTPTSVKFGIAFENADQGSYLCTEQSAPAPDAPTILKEGKTVASPEEVTIDNLKSGTVYRISAVAVRGRVTSEVKMIEMTTGIPAPTIALSVGTASEEGLTFHVDLTDAERTAYVCIEKSEETEIPTAAEILETGTAIEEAGEIGVTDLAPGTTYIIAVAGVNKEVYSEVETLEMTTSTPATPIVSLVEGTPAQNELSFYLATSNAERTAYVCFEKSVTTTIPAAAEILASGTAITDTKVTVTGLKGGTTYVIAVAASNKSVYSEVKTLEMTTEPEQAGPIVFTTQADGGYYGDSHNTGWAEYCFVVADGKTTESNGVHTTVGAGRAMSFDLYQFKSYSTLIKIPARTYDYNTNYGMNTFAPDKTFCMVNDGNGHVTKIEFKAGTIDVKLVGTTYTITAKLTTTTDEAFEATYTGALTIENRESVDKDLPLIERDLTGMTFIRALAKYYSYGDQADNCIVNLYDVEPTISYGSDYLSQPGHLVSLDLSTAVSAEMALQEGTYTVSDSGAPGTFGPGYQTKFQDMVMAVGTYCEEMDSNRILYYGYNTGGTVKITKVGDNYRFELDFTTDKGYKISGTYEGKVEMTDKRSSSASAAASARALMLRRQ